MNKNLSYIILVAIVAAAFVIVFDTFPRTRISELEKRELATFPEFTWDRLWSGAFTNDVSTWFSDSEPYRDHIMTLSMWVKDKLGISLGEENVKFHAAETTSAPSSPLNSPRGGASEMGENSNSDGEELSELDDDPNFVLEENAKIAHAGIIVVGTGENVRALMAYGGEANGGKPYADVANLYKRTFGPKVNVYCMVVPTAIEFYCPEKVQNVTKSQLATTEHIFSCLDADVKPVDIYHPLKRHRSEPIYLRTDHHWSPLGGFYAAQAFAKVAGVPFKDLTHYEQRVVHGFVGSMYGYSKDIAVKNAPEDFVYYMPTEVEYTTTYINYSINDHYQVTGEGRPYQSQFFFHYKDGNGGAYCTMMGGDSKITQVRTGTKNGRRVIILKDSFGNMLPGYLFYSFEEIHVIDARYFTKDMVKYVEDNRITDILFANNIFSAYGGSTAVAYRRFLHQQWSPPAASASQRTTAHSDSAATSSQPVSTSDVSTATPDVQSAPVETPKNPDVSTDEGEGT